MKTYLVLIKVGDESSLLVVDNSGLEVLLNCDGIDCVKTLLSFKSKNEHISDNEKINIRRLDIAV